MSTYEMCKTLISNGRYKKEKMLRDLDIFLLGERVTAEEYEELVAMLN